MRKGKELIKKPIILNDNSQIFNQIIVKNLIIDHKTNKLIGFLVEDSSGKTRDEIVPFEQVEAIASRGIVAPSSPGSLPLPQAQHIQEALEQEIVLEGRPVMTPEGDYLGRLQDVYFDPDTGKIEGYEVIPPRDRPKQFVRAAKIDQGLKNSVALIQLTEAHPSLSQTISGALAEAKPLSLTLSSPKQATTELPSHSQVKPFSGRFLERIKGRRVQQLVCDAQGNAIATPGQVVTQRLLEQVKQKGYEAQLCAAVGLETMKTSTFQPSSRSRSYSKRQLDRRVKQALGHPVTRMIVDRQNRVILNVGDLITYRAVDRAREAKVLPLLLDAVYRSP